ncbi:hypothetical protein BDQ12DRAFT_178919 [Crucibulum laeve]|uniref:Uncharacterized protein n=1 Tax=Crucibulum laeve TaxID=68775 RepID=A0A5C3MD84_9AGAR|nr:hypothetical protein BDQ12DRAFT_178919 [Crucibulum laeve]
MSIFIRPDSPPPRQPSPEPLSTPLPSPPPRYSKRDRTSSKRPHQSRAAAPMFPPGLHPFPDAHRSLLSIRSCDNMRDKENRHRVGVQEEEPTRKRTRSTLNASAYPRVASSHNPIPLSSEYQPRHRSLSYAIPYRSPPPSPTLAAAPPPVPPLPVFTLSSPAHKPTACPRTQPITPIYLPDMEQLSPISELPAPLFSSPKLQRPSSAPEKRGGIGMTCFKFFSLGNASQRGQRTTAT